jgi:hypothetical protein
LKESLSQAAGVHPDDAALYLLGPFLAAGVGCGLWIRQRLVHAVCSAAALPSVSEVNLLILRAPADETNSAFALTHAVGWATRLYGIVPAALSALMVERSWAAASRAVWCVGICLAVVVALDWWALGLLGLLWKWSDGHPLLAYPLNVFLLYIALCVVSSLTLFIAALWIAASAFVLGPAAAIAALWLEISAEVGPSGGCRLWQLSYPDTPGWPLDFMHSRLYNDPAAIDQLIQWIVESDGDA